MAADQQALFYQTDLTQWNTLIPIDCIFNCLEPPIESYQRNLFLRKFLANDKLLKQFSYKTSNKYPWKIELSPDGLMIVILKNNNVELRSSKLDFNHINFHCQIYRDIYPQWRCASWSNLSNYFGISFSNGMCNIWDIHGSRLVFKYSKLNDFDPVIKLIITNISKNRIKVYVITLKGRILMYIIDNLKIINHSESFCDVVSTPILCCEVSLHRNLLVLGTYNQSNSNEACKNGLVSCRFIDEEPFIVSNVPKNEICLRKTWISTLFRKNSVDGVHVIRISKDDTKLAAIHLSGILTVWQYPSMKILIKWSSSSDLTNQILTSDFTKHKVMPENFSDCSILQICWWNSEHVVIALQNGRIVILNTDQSNSGNIYLNPFPQIQESTEKSFYSLHCTSKYINKELDMKNNISIIESFPLKIWKSIGNMLKFLVQDDSFNCFKKNIEMCSLKFQLSCFKLTTPEELFEIQIIKKQYSEALELADKYNLDSDIVFQKQWRDSDKSIEDIEKILIRIKKRNWILNECIERIPSHIESMKYLFQLGLKLTRFTELENCITDHNRCEHNKIDENFNPKFCEREQCGEHFQTINVEDLNLVQIELVRIRLKLLSYCDKLCLYENIIQSTNSSFQWQLFQEFKNLSPFELAIKFANSGSIIELEILLKFFNVNLKEHILVILSNIPECLEPRTYRNLFNYLPMFEVKKNQTGNNTDSETVKQLDWCETENFRVISNSISFENETYEIYYQNHPELKYLRLDIDDDLTCRSIFTKWSNMRIRNIEEKTLNAEYALEFLNFIKSFNVKIDDDLEFNLHFLCEAVYNCQIVNAFLSLSEFLSMSYFEKAKLLMSRTDNERFLIHFDRWFIPFLQEIHAQSSIKSLEFFEIYLQYLGLDSLICTRKILEDKDCLSALLNIIDFQRFIRIYLSILLNDDDISHINECGKISRLLGSLISVKCVSNPDQFISEEKQLQDINNYISVLRMMEKYDLHKSIKFIDTNKMNGEIVENLITSMVFQYLKSIKNLNKTTVKSVFIEIQSSISIVFKSIHPKLIYKNLLKSLLESGDKKKINLASEFMDLTSKLSTINDVNSDDKLLDFNEATICIATAAQNYINTSTSCKDENFQLAKYCFNLLKESNEEIENELNLIKCCEFLEKYNCSLVPIEVRSVTDRFQLLKSCLEKNKSLYRNLEEIVEAAGFLCSDKKTKQKLKFNEGEALRLVGEKALINNDMEILEIVIASLIHRNHKPCWKECVKCIQNSEFPFEKKLNLGKYALTHCPKSELRNIIRLIKEIELESFHLLEIANNSDDSLIADSNTNSTLIKQPIKFLSSGLTDISSRLSLKSLIDKSSDTLMKISNQVIQLGGQGNTHEFYRNIDCKQLNKMTFNLIYQNKGTFEMKSKQNSEFNSLIKIFTMCSVLPTFEKQSEIDQIHLKLLKFHLNSDTYLSLIHSIFIDDLNLIYNIRHDFTPNLFNRALILSMITFNLISKYTSQVQFTDLFKTNLSSISEKLSENELSIFQKIEQEFKDHYFLDQITKFYQGICVTRFFSSVDYREEIIFKLCEFLDSVESFKYALQMGSRYGIDRNVLLRKYLKSFIYKIGNSKEINFEKEYALFHSVFDWTSLMEDRKTLRKDLESFVISDEKSRVAYFKVILNIFQSINCEFVLFNKSVKDHIDFMELYDSIYSNTTDCSYFDLIIGPDKKIIEALKVVINVDNLESCSKLMEEFDLSQQFLQIKNDFSGVLANQTLWSNEISTGENFTERFNKSLENFSLSDYKNCKDFIYSTLFERSKLYIDLTEKINVLKIAEKYVNRKCESCDNDENEWSKVNMEIDIWLDHIENSVTKVVNQLRSMKNISDEIIRFAEYLPPENYWDCLMNEMLLSRVSYQNFFTFTWELNIESLIIEDVLADYISHILFSKFVSAKSVLDQLNQIFDEFDEYLDSESVENIITTILTNSKFELKPNIIHWLLNEIIYRIRRNKSACKFDLNTQIINIISKWKIPFNKRLEISNSNNIFIIDALIQDCDSPTQMTLISKVIELIELVHEDNNLWQCWVKCCIIKGSEYTKIIYEQFCSLKANKLYKDRFTKLSKDAIQSLICFNSSEAISLLILKDPIESVDQIQTILTDLKSDPTEYTNTMKNINIKSLKIIVDSKLIPAYAKTILFQRLVNFITKEQDDPNIVQDVIEQLKNKGLHDEASWLASSSTHINPAKKTIEMVSGFWKRFSTGGNL